MANSSAVRVRFAPSPTGFLHVGGARVALFNWLYAKNQGGAFLLRIEDTDRERSEDRYTQDILASLKWLGLDWDEEPVFQSKRFERYHAVAEELRKQGKSYYCRCTPAELDAVRELCAKEKKPFRYPGTCREKGYGKENAVLRIANPKEGSTAFTDLVRGHISFENKDLDDWVCIRADGAPTYNFTVVIDDHDSQMTHILRGDDHINNTPKQILLYQANGWTPPHFAHLPMILGMDKTKLSKRHGAASTLEYQKLGYLPEALLCFLVRLGWSHGDQEIFTIDELKQFFGLGAIGKAAAVFNPEKLNWLSGHYMRDTPAPVLKKYIDTFFADAVPYLAKEPAQNIELGISIIQGKVKTVAELVDQLRVLFDTDPSYGVEDIPLEDRVKMKSYLEAFLPKFQESPTDKERLETEARALADGLGIKLTPIAQAVRFAMTGGKVSPGLFEMLLAMGQERVERRLGKALAALGAH